MNNLTIKHHSAELTPLYVVPKIDEDTTVPVESNQTTSKVIEDMQARYWKVIDSRKFDKYMAESRNRVLMDVKKFFLVWDLWIN